MRPLIEDSRLKEAFSFTLLLEGPSVFEPDVLQALLEAGCDDALFGERNGVQYADFERDAGTYVDAVTSAIRDVESSVRGLSVTRLEPEEQVGVDDIALTNLP